MNKIGIYYAYWTSEWDADFVPFVARVKRLGFDVLEINAGTTLTMSAADKDRLRKTAADHAVELTACIGMPPHQDIASPDAAVRAAGVEALKRMAAGVASVGVKTLGGIVYSSWPGKLPTGADRRTLVDHSIAGMKQVMPVAAGSGVTLCMEVVNRFEQYAMNTAAEAVEYVRRVDHPNCRVLLDSFHMNIEEDDLAGAIRVAAPVLGHFHLGETNRRPPGRGRMAWDEIFGTLKAVGYTGVLTMEPFVAPGGQVGRDISVYRDLRDGRDLDAEAAAACAFVRSELAD